MVRLFALLCSFLLTLTLGCSDLGIVPPPKPTSSPQPIVGVSFPPQPVLAVSPAPALPDGLTLPLGFSGSSVAQISEARELAALPNGDLLVGTSGTSVMIVPNAESGGTAGVPTTFATLPGDLDAQGVAFGPDGNVYVATTQHLWKFAYQTGAQTGRNPQLVATYRQGPVAPNSDGDTHKSASVALSPTTIYIGIGSSCNACVEVDPTRATIQQVPIGGGKMTTRATRIRNAIALTVNPATGNLWAGGAGQDKVPYGHPYEYMDNVSAHSGVADYGWPDCEENQHAYGQAQCSGTVVPLVEFSAYSTHIGAVFYPSNQSGAHAFPSEYRGGLFVTNHGSWHCCPSSIPLVAFVPMTGDKPRTPVSWDNPSVQWQSFLLDGNTSTSSTGYLYRFTGIAVGSQGSLFIADDKKGMIYRVRPSGTR